MRFQGALKRLSIFLTIIIATAININAEQNYAIPDFAYPKTASSNAIAKLNASLKSGDDILAIRQLMDYGLAQSVIGNDNIHGVISKIDSVKPLLQKESSRALISLLKAKIYSDIYLANKYKFDNRKLPLSPLPADYNEWSGDQFHQVISTLCDEALGAKAALERERLSDYKLIIDVSNEDIVYFPSLYDFVAYRTIDFRSNLSRFANCFSILILTDRSTFLANPVYTPTSAEAEKILATYADLLRFHANDIAPLIYADIQRLAFIHSGIYSSMNESSSATYNALLKDLFSQYSHNQYSGLVLEEVLYDEYDAEFYRTVSDFCKRFPSYNRINCLKNILSRMQHKSVEIKAQQFAIPGKEFPIIIDAANINKVTLCIYAVDIDKFSNDTNPHYTNKKLISEKELHITGITPFSTREKINVTLNEPGKYIVIANAPGINTDESIYAATIHCTKLSIGVSKSTKSNEIIVSESSSGQPVKDALIQYRPIWNPNLIEKLGLTDVYGFYKIGQSLSGDFFAEKQEMGYTQPIYVHKAYTSSTFSSTLFGHIFTSLAIYHPGDIVEFSALVYNSDISRIKIAKNKAIKAILKNTNRTPIDTLELTTDNWGRCNGSFQIPTNELSGNYSVCLIDPSDNNRMFYQQNISVSDYKLPSFFTEVTSVLKSIPEDGDVTIKGRVQTYSGVGLPAVSLNITLSAEQWHWWRGSNAVDFYSVSDTTDSRGEFSIVVSKKALDYSPAPKGYFTIQIDATSASGESQQTVASFFRSQAYSISANISKNIDITNPTTLDVDVMRSDGAVVDTIVNYTLRDLNNKVILASSFHSNKAIVDWRKVKSGEYTLTMRIKGNLADSTTCKDIILYRPKDKRSPVDKSLWMPYTDNPTIILDHNRQAELIYATTKPETHILYTLSDADSIIHREWIKAKAGMHTLQVSIPKNCLEPNAILYSVADFKASVYSFNFEQASIPAVKITTESFRNRIIPGSDETWTFRTIDQNGNPISSAMILNMYNGALDAIKKANWGFNPIKYSNGSTKIYAKTFWHNNIFLFGWSQYSDELSCDHLSNPWFRLNKTNSFITSKYIGARKLTMANSAITSYAHMDSAVAHEEELVVDEDLSSSEISLKENTKTTFEYRDAETPLAIYAPTLNTDTEGRLSFSFRVPNANTTWRFRALAFTENLLTDQFLADVIANKPIMVQPNRPRFVRTGDKIDISSLVINNSDSTQNITTVVEFFEPSNQAIISKFSFDSVVEKGMTVTVTAPLDVPLDLPFIGYRVKSYTDKFADGEQSLIPILSSSSQVIETTPFYISPDSLHFSLQIPQLPDSSRVTLQYCDNPIWTVVTALPGLRSKKISTPSDAANAIFSAAIADGLMRNYPSIANAISLWNESNKSDSTLTSMLERNSDLKTMLLNATPWMVDAMTDSERMQRLALLFDKNEIEKVYSEAIATLQSLQRNNGGWAWISQSNSASIWATESALFTLGYLNMLKYLPSKKELTKLIEQALAWHQKEIIAEHRKYPKHSYYNFLSLRDLWPQFRPSAQGKSIVASEVQKLVKNWKKLSVGTKAEAARLLYNNGYRTLSRSVVASLREFAETSPEKGMWWPSLGDNYGGSLLQVGHTANALLSIKKIEPNSSDIDAICQWLILQKEAQNWGSSAMTSFIITAILNTSSKWLCEASDISISINDTPLSVNYTDSYLGNFRADISDMNPSEATLTITKSEGTPAWGAIHSNSERSMSSVEAASCDAISIEKRIFKSVGHEWSSADSLKVGDRVKVQLLIHANRDMQYMAITDERAACFEPVEQMPRPIYSEGLCFYRENRDASTNIFVSNMPKGTYMLEYEMWVNNSGEFSSGIATIQSQYAPQLSAHSSGNKISISAN